MYLTKHAIEKNINIALKARNNKELTANSKFTIEKEALLLIIQRRIQSCNNHMKYVSNIWRIVWN